MLLSEFHPQTADDFIGPAHAVLLRLDRLLTLSKASGHPIKVLLLGPPGCGKSELAAWLMRGFGCDKWHSTILNGTRVGVEQIEDIARSCHLKELFGTYRVIRFEEVDRLSAAAQGRAHTFLDDLPPYTAVIATSNIEADKFSKPFQSRFKVFPVAAPSDAEIEALLARLSNLPRIVCRQIATFACGDVRQALNDADVELLGQPLLKAA